MVMGNSAGSDTLWIQEKVGSQAVLAVRSRAVGPFVQVQFDLRALASLGLFRGYRNMPVNMPHAWINP